MYLKFRLLVTPYLTNPNTNQNACNANGVRTCKAPDVDEDDEGDDDEPSPVTR